VRRTNAALPVHPTVRAAFAIAANSIQPEDGKDYFTMKEVQVGREKVLKPCVIDRWMCLKILLTFTPRKRIEVLRLVHPQAAARQYAEGEATRYPHWLPAQSRSRPSAYPFNEQLANALLTSTGGGKRARHYSGALRPAVDAFFHVSEHCVDHVAKAKIFWKRAFEFSFDEVNTIHE
jgi:hypothetical protein